MVGQGSPRASQRRLASTAGRKAIRWSCRVALLVWLIWVPQALVAETMRVRIAWGGGERRWEGAISLSSEGTLANPQPLGIEADEPGSMWLEGGRLMIRQRSVRAYDGVDLQVTAPLDTKLLVKLTADDDPDRSIDVEVPLAGLSGKIFDRQLDLQGNRLLVRRTPGDRLRVHLQRDLLIFLPGEVFDCTLEPHLLPLPDNSKVKIEAKLVVARSNKELWKAEPKEVQTGQPVAIPLKFKLPQQEGVYELVVKATHTADWKQAVRRPLRPQDWTRTVAERNVQLLVLGVDGPTNSPAAEQTLSQVGNTIDPADPRWYEKLGLDKLPKLPKLPRWDGPLGNGNTTLQQHSLGKLVRLNANSQSPDVSWEAYTLPVDEPGNDGTWRPHVLEVDYPSDVSQTLGISILEPNAAGALRPIGLDTGVDSTAQFRDGPPRLMRHRLVFWPRTKTPRVLISNLRDGSPAVYGKLRVYSGWEHLPHSPAARPGPGRRLMAAYFDRPLFPENFSARESLDRWSGRSLDDWITFYEGGTRLVEYLQYVGYNGLMISVLADGSTIYPSRILQPTPRYDTGVFFATGQDPVRKDVLEMLFRLFDREGLQLIPAVEFAAPLPELEAVIREPGTAGEGIEWIGPDGRSRRRTHLARQGLSPYYNTLHPLVQEEMLRVVRELVGRYADHKSFGGLAIQLSAQGYAQLPGPDWGMDDVTIGRFQQDTGLQLPAAEAGPERFARRASLLAEEHRQLWLQWRSSQLGQFYRRVQTELTALRPGSRLYLAGSGVLAGDEMQSKLRPTLLRRTTMAEALLQVGIDVRHYQDTGRQDAGELVLLRPERTEHTGNLNRRALNLAINHMPDVDGCFTNQTVPGSLFFHPPLKVRVESFDRKSPFKVTYTRLVSHPVASGPQNRQRFVRSLTTLDSQVMVDGGWMLPLGQEESIRDLVAAYRSLPATSFHRVGDQRGNGSSQPVTFRYGVSAGYTYVYAVNDAPFCTSASVRVQAPSGCRLEELTGMRQVPALRRDTNGTYWQVELEPYDLVAVRLSTAQAKLFRPEATLHTTVKGALVKRIRDLGDRAASLRNPSPLLKVIENSGFELPATAGNPIPGWAITQGAGVAIQSDNTQRYGGNRSVKLSTNGPWACLVSQPFDPPATGRLSMSMWLRVADAAAQPSFRLALHGRLHDRDYYSFAPVGARTTVPISTQWSQYVFRVDDLPLEGLSELRVRFDLSGPGEVWVDDVQLNDLQFSVNELKELQKLIYRANVMLDGGQVGDCLRLLDGYWPRFLEANVPLRIPVAQKPERHATKPPGVMDRVKGLLPKSLRF